MSSMSFGDHAYAGKFRDLITRIARQVIRDERPEPRIGKVYSYNNSTQTAMVLFAGETVDSLVKVRVAKDMAPTRVMDTTFETLGYNAPADIVRVWGVPGSYFILDYYSGNPQPNNLIGMPLPWLTDTPPTGYIMLAGQAENRLVYPDLFDLWGETFGPGDGVSTFGIPDARGKVLLGANDLYDLGTSGGDMEKTLTVAQLPPHRHGQGGHTWAWGGGNGTVHINSDAIAGPAASNNLYTHQGANDWANTGSVGSGDPIDITPAHLAVNWITRAI